MRCLWRGFQAGSIAAAVMLILADICSAQIFRFGDWGGEYESGNEYERQTITTGTSESSRFQNVLSENRLTVRNTGAYIYDPRLINFSLGGTFGLSQNWLNTNGGHDSQSTLLWGYDFFANILQEKPVSLNVFANRNQSTLSGDLAGRVSITGENRGATLFAKR